MSNVSALSQGENTRIIIPLTIFRTIELPDYSQSKPREFHESEH